MKQTLPVDFEKNDDKALGYITSTGMIVLFSTTTTHGMRQDAHDHWRLPTIDIRSVRQQNTTRL